jgi:hypothetical protein
VVANEGWQNFFPKADIVVEGTTTSDHLPIFVNLQDEENVVRSKSNFKHEASWVLDGEYVEVVNRAWRERAVGTDSWRCLRSKMGRCKRELKIWQAKKKGPENDIKNICQSLTALQAVEGPQNLTEIRRLQDKVQTIMEQEEAQWKQRAKVEWLRSGDQNTKFFHACANQRRSANKIRMVRDMGGITRESHEAIGKAFVDYFSCLFTSEQPANVAECLEFLPSKISAEMNARLLRPFTSDEVGIALKQMAPLKAPGPDGFNACFYQKNWNLVGSNVCNVVLSCLNSGMINKELNFTYIALIPKSKNAATVNDYRPISITDNILAAYETLHTMHSRMYGKSGFMAIKLDMSKAYDRVEWGFSGSCNEKIGFAQRWINLIMMCVRTTTFSIIVNGQPMGQIFPS